MTDPLAELLRDTYGTGLNMDEVQNAGDWFAAYAAHLRAAGVTVGDAGHPHDGYAYDGCKCVCCLNVRALATLDRDRERLAALEGALNTALNQWRAYSDETRGPIHDFDYIEDSADHGDEEARMFQAALAALKGATS